LTIGEVAQALGVSKGTVSRAITGKGRIADATKARIVEYMKAHDFLPNAAAQNLSTRKTMTIAYTVPTDRGLTHLSFFLQALIGAIEQAMAHSYDILTVSNTTAAVKRLVAQRKVDAVIVSRDPRRSQMFDYLRAADLPFVLIGPTAHPGVVRIDHDHRAACREFTAAVLRQWSGRAGLLVGPWSDLVSQARFDGFSQALGVTSAVVGEGGESAVSGLTHAGGAAPVAWGAVDEESVVRGFTQLIDAGADIVFCGDDRICGHLESAILTGRLPASTRSVRVASYHGSASLEALNPQVPALRFDSAALGSAAFSLLLDRIGGKDVSDVTIGYEIVLGDRDGRLAAACGHPVQGPLSTDPVPPGPPLSDPNKLSLVSPQESPQTEAVPSADSDESPLE
jgi:DNA-binding LacI/PurR family transcriptional regulator